MPTIHGRALSDDQASYYEFLAQDFPRQHKYREEYGRMIAALIASSRTDSDGTMTTTMGYLALSNEAGVSSERAFRFLERLEKTGVLVRTRKLWYPYSNNWRYLRTFDPTKRLKGQRAT